MSYKTIFSPILADAEATFGRTKFAGQPEIEIRFYEEQNRPFNFKGRMNSLGVSRSTFERVQKVIRSQSPVPQHFHTIDYIDVSGQRITSAAKEGSHKQEISSIKKDQIWPPSTADHSALRQYNISKFTISDEKPTILAKSLVLPTPGNKLTRVKNRYSYYWKGPEGKFTPGVIRVDFTEVNQTSSEESKTIWEIELELLKVAGQYKFSQLLSAVGNLVTIIQGSSLLYSLDQKHKVDQLITDSLGYVGSGSPGTPGFVKNMMVEARNLKLRDMVMGGIVPTSSGKSIHYTVTHKAEGLRKLVVIDDTGIWLISPNKEYSLVSTQSGFGMNRTILDGEYLPEETSAKCYFLIFDCIRFNNIDIRTKTHSQRLAYAYQVYNLKIAAKDGGPPVEFFKESTTVRLGTKIFQSLGDTSESFFRGIETIQSHAVPYSTDGFIFTPEEATYNPGASKEIMSKRTLTRIPDICKWKPYKDLTIDLQYRLTLGASPPQELWAGAPMGGTGELTKFEGTTDFPFNVATDVIWDHELIKEVPSGTIIEFGPVSEELGESGVKLKPIRFRKDKLYPNRIDVAQDVWYDLHRPLSLNTLRGKTFDLVRAYHNQIKKRLLSRFKFEDYESAIPSGSWVVDIGCGRGGDLRKLSHVSKILGIEPNEANLAEYTRRLAICQTDVKFPTVRTIQCGGEESDIIRKEASELFTHSKIPSLHIVMMLSLSFFWTPDGKDRLAGLARTINGLCEDYHAKGGTSPVQFHFMTIEGQATRSLFETYGSEVTLGPAKFTLAADKSVHVHIEGTIVDDQIEGLVNLDELWELISFDPPSKILRANEEEFLNNDEKKFTQLYIFGIASENKKEKKVAIKMHRLTKTPVNDFVYKKGISSSATSAYVLDQHGLELDTEKMYIPGRDSSSTWIFNYKPTEEEAEEAEFTVIHTNEIDYSAYHVILLACSHTYQNSTRTTVRNKMIEDLKRSLFTMLIKENPDVPLGKLPDVYKGEDVRSLIKGGEDMPLNSYFLTTYNGYFWARSKDSTSHSIINDAKWLVNKLHLTVDEVAVVCGMLKLNLHIIRNKTVKSRGTLKTQDEWLVFQYNNDPDNTNNYIIMKELQADGIPVCYELLGRRDSDGVIQTLFEPGDEILGSTD